MSGAGGVIATILTAVPITVGAIYRAHERTRARWTMRNHDPLDGDAREGDLVFVSGIVRALDETLVAPLSGRTCVAYRSRAWQPWAELNRHETMQLRPFIVESDDGGGPIVVDGDRALFGVHPQPLVPRNPEREASFRARHALAKGNNTRFSEVLIELGAHVIVGGTLVLVPREAPPTGELGFRDLPPPDPQLVGSRESPLIILAR